MSWPGIVTKNPAQSLLLTRPVSGGNHSGPELDSPNLKETLFPKVKAWLAAEAENFTDSPPEAAAHVDPFVPIMGFNSVYLNPLGPDFEGIALTFNAQMLDSKTISLTDIQLHPTVAMGVHVVHPLFTVHPLGQAPNPDPVDSFSGLDKIFEAGKPGTLGAGTLILLNFSTDAKLSFGFKEITTVVPASPEVGSCKNLQSFDAVREQFTKCAECHGGADAQANAAVDMSGFSAPPGTPLHSMLCGQIKNRVNPLDPPKSQIFVTTNPTENNAHPFKFDGIASSFIMFREAVSPWIAAEK